MARVLVRMQQKFCTWSWGPNFPLEEGDYPDRFFSHKKKVLKEMVRLMRSDEALEFLAPQHQIFAFIFEVYVFPDLAAEIEAKAEAQATEEEEKV